MYENVKPFNERIKNKILLKIGNKTLLEYHMERLQQSKLANRIIVATTENKEDDKIVELCKKKDYLYFRGSEKNVYDRFYKTSLKYKRGFSPNLSLHKISSSLFLL